MITLNLIKRNTERLFELERGSLKSRSRLPAIVDGRHAYWLAALYFGFGITHAAKAIDRHHASAYNAVTRCLYLCQAESGYKKKVIKLIENLKGYEKTEKTRHSIALFRSAVDAML